MLGYKSLFSATLDIRNRFAGRENDIIKVIILSLDKRYDELHVWFFESPELVAPLSKNDIILACYYAPDGNWVKFYGDKLYWLLTDRHIALDILNNTIFYDEDFPISGSDMLPSWLVDEIESYV